MNTDQNAENKQIDIKSIKPDECLNFIWNALNKASNKGVFNIDESYSIRVVFHKLTEIVTEKTEDINK